MRIPQNEGLGGQDSLQACPVPRPVQSNGKVRYGKITALP